MKEFGYKKDNALAILSGLAIVFPIVFWKYPDIAIWVTPFVLIYSIFQALHPLANVTIAEDEIRIRFALPFRKNVNLAFTDVESYSPMKMKNLRKKEILIYGFLKRKNGDSIMLSASGTKDFENLSTILEGAFPKNEDELNQSSHTTPASAPR